MYKRIKQTPDSKCFVVGDLHGSLALLHQNLLDVGFDYEKDIVVAVGDLIDRGEDSLGCLRLLNEPWFHTVRGNHEQMAFSAVNTTHPFGKLEAEMLWKHNGGNWYFKLDLKATREADTLLGEQVPILPYFIELVGTNGTTVVAHADYPCNDYEFGKEVSSRVAVWNRNRINSGCKKPIEGADQFIFGHTPIDEVFSYANISYIDTGAVFSGNLTLVRVW